MSSAVSSELTGRLLEGRYRIESRIGEDETATIYRATDNVLTRPVTVKVLDPRLAADPEFVARVERQISAAASVHDPEVPTVYDIGLDGDVHYIVTEYRNAAEPSPTITTPTVSTPSVTAATERPKPKATHPRRATTLPLGIRVVGIYFLLLAATLIAVGAVTIRLTRNQLTNDLENRLSAAVSSFQTGPATRVTRAADLAAEARTWLAAQALPADEVVAVRTQAGEVLTSTGGLDLQRVEQSRELLTADQSGWHTVDGADGSVRALTVPLERNGKPAGTIVAAAELSSVDSTLDALLSSVAWASGIGLALATVLALAFLRRTLRPLARFSREVGAVEESGDLTRRVDDGPRDEVGRVAEAFNRMLASLEEAFRSQRRFVSDASHELRTPLTVARGQLELLAQELQSADARGSLGVAVDEIDRMGRIVEDLLLLARLDEGLPLKRESVEVELVLEEALLRATVATRRHVVVEAEPGLCALADHDRLLQVVSNLVTNAIEHAGDDADITLSTRRSGGRVVIEVHDTGRGITPEDLPHVFERFYRGGSRGGDVGGAGLGLAIAASLTRAMDGEIDVQSTSGAGTTFTVSMQAAATA